MPWEWYLGWEDVFFRCFPLASLAFLIGTFSIYQDGGLDHLPRFSISVRTPSKRLSKSPTSQNPIPESYFHVSPKKGKNPNELHLFLPVSGVLQKMFQTGSSGYLIGYLITMGDWHPI